MNGKQRPIVAQTLIKPAQQIEPNPAAVTAKLGTAAMMAGSSAMARLTSSPEFMQQMMVVGRLGTRDFASGGKQVWIFYLKISEKN